MSRLARSRDWRHAANTVISGDFLPKIGGAHYWLYECYKRWSSPVSVLTRSYSEHRESAESERSFDRETHGSLEIFREITPTRDLTLLSFDALRSYVRQLRSLRRLAGENPVILHCLKAYPDGFAGALYKLLWPGSATLVVYAHGEEVLTARSSRQLKLMARYAYRTANLIIANSESTCGLLRELSPSGKVVCVHPGVDPISFEVSAEGALNYRATWGWPAGTVVLSTLARMEPRKNHVMGLKVVRKLRDEGIPLAFVCAGDGEERSHLEETARQMGLQEWVRFPGVISEREKRFLFAASDIYAMPSIQVGEMIEGFGIVLLEAAAAGIPVICGNSGGQPEAVRDGENGIVVDGRHLEPVAAAVRRLALDPVLRKRMGERGRIWAAEHAWEHVVQRTRNAIQVALSH